MKQEASIVRNVLFRYITSLYRTYCIIIVAVQQIYKHYLSIIFMCYWFIHRGWFLLSKSLKFFIVAALEH